MIKSLTYILVMLGIMFFAHHVHAQGTLESESAEVSFPLKTTDIEVRLLDADTKKLIPAKLEVKDIEANKTVFNENVNSGTATVELFNAQEYSFQASSEKFRDTLLTITTDTTFISVYLNPKKIEYEIDVADFDSDDDLPFGIKLKNKNRNEVIELDPKDAKNGKYKVRIREDDEYELEVKNPNDYIFYSNTINSESDKAQGNKKLNIKMTKLKAGARIPLHNITFEYKKWDLNQHSKDEINRIVKLLKDHPNLKIEIAAYTDIKGTHRKNLILSQKRAQAVFEYLITKDVFAKRFVTKGYGSANPIATNSTDEGRAKNRRFELLILSL